jgi:thiosulfate/3-mercaptopyruvate sulfurtransferase
MATTKSPLITARQLHDSLDRVSVLDVRYRMGGPTGAAEYTRGHVPGAAYVDLDTDLAGPVRPDGSGGRHPLPDPAVFEAAMRRAGVRQGLPVVVYDDWAARAAGRAWWLLRDAGHPEVRVLDGGLSAWLAAGYAVEAGTATVEPGDFAAMPGALPCIDADSLLAFDGAIVDARAAQRYRGEVEPVDPVAGHLPGAVNVPTEANLGADGTFRSAAELAQLYPAGEVVCYCGSGVTANHALLALAIQGREGVLYPGSWSDWISDPSRPVVTEE